MNKATRLLVAVHEAPVDVVSWALGAHPDSVPLTLNTLALLCFAIWWMVTCRLVLRAWLRYQSPILFNLLENRLILPIAWWTLAVSALTFAVGPFRDLLPMQATGVLTEIGILGTYCTSVWLFWRLLPPRRVDGNLGTAMWAAQCDIRARWDVPFSIPIRLAHRARRNPGSQGLVHATLGPAPETARRHISILGGSGSGKGYYVLGHILSSARLPFIYQDVKGECPNLLRRWRAQGKPPIVWGAARPGGWQSIGWNPLQECYDDPDFEDAAATLAAAILPARGLSDNQWIIDTARSFLRLFFVSRLYRSLGHLYDDLRDQGFIAVYVRCGQTPGMTEQLSGKNVKEYVTNSIMVPLETFATGWGRLVTSDHCFSLADALTRDVYVLSNENIEARRLPLHIFWRLLLTRLLRASRVRTMLLLDEGLAAGYLPGLPDTLNTIRSKGGTVVFSYQNTGGLQAVYDRETKAVSEAFGSSIVLLSGLNADDLKTVSDQMGQWSVRMQSSLGGKRGEQAASLLPLNVAQSLSLREGQYWGIIRMPGITTNGRPILARLVPSWFDITEPTQQEMDELRRAFPARTNQAPEPHRTLPPTQGQELALPDSPFGP